MCDPNQNIDQRVKGATYVANLIEAEPELQRLALICEQFPQKLSAYFSNPVAGDTNNAADMKRVRTTVFWKYRIYTTLDLILHKCSGYNLGYAFGFEYLKSKL